jgi:hypothetical protein
MTKDAMQMTDAEWQQAIRNFQHQEHWKREKAREDAYLAALAKPEPSEPDPGEQNPGDPPTEDDLAASVAAAAERYLKGRGA